MTEPTPPVPPPYQPVPYPYPVVVTQPTDGLAVAGMICGILGLLFSWIPFVGTIAWFLVLPGLVMSVVAQHRRSSGMAIAGIVTSGIGLLICCSYVFVILVGMASGAR
jgi:hypothetical protein